MRILVLAVLTALAIFVGRGFIVPAMEATAEEETAERDPEGRVKAALDRVGPGLREDLAALGLDWGAPVFLRIFKEERELEIWLEKEGKFEKFRTYQVAGMSGDLGPKLAEGDRQAPEGFYFVTRSRMHPASDFHLAFNIGYPNDFDRALNRTGSFIMVHGSDCSVGCFAMTDEKVEEIYTLCDQALHGGQPYFRVHIFPFRMTGERLHAENENRWHGFWQNLREGYRWFEEKRVPPNVLVNKGRYVFQEN